MPWSFRKQVDFKLGQKCWALVEEMQSQNQLLINFEGHLIRVTNDTNNQLRVGQRIQLSVIGIHPTRFKLVHRTNSKKIPLDVEV
jgi:hypothetical protein